MSVKSTDGIETNLMLEYEMWQLVSLALKQPLYFFGVHLSLSYYKSQLYVSLPKYKFSSKQQKSQMKIDCFFICYICF